MADLGDGESIEVQGSGSTRYTIKNTGGVYSCSCPAWSFQSLGIEKRTCKHIKKLRGDAAEAARLAAATSRGAVRPRSAAPTTPVAGASPIATAPDADTNVDTSESPGQSPPALLLAHTWDSTIDLSGWWMSEKLDGVRAYWDGKTFISRLGNQFFAPDWFTDGLPDVPLDGELWGGRKQFQRTVGIVRRQDRSDHWKSITFLVFDAPKMNAHFEERLAFCENILRVKPSPYARSVDQTRCRGIDHLHAELARVEALGGEGLMMRQPGSKYEVGRSSSLLKVKTFVDAEARVVEHVAGAGRHRGRTGALLVELPNGKRFSVGTGLSDRERETPPPVGSIITFRYQELTDGGIPRFPSFVRIRPDATWPPPADGTNASGTRKRSV
ncbi:MAG: DNA ligase [Polyangiaceae bacterium]|nr:DNA ligase [Polyangiaceae bacterium]